MSFKKTQCSLSFIVINVITINFDEINSYAQLFYVLVITVTDRKSGTSLITKFN
jgi:hypothetical protein